MKINEEADYDIVDKFNKLEKNKFGRIIKDEPTILKTQWVKIS